MRKLWTRAAAQAHYTKVQTAARRMALHTAQPATISKSLPGAPEHELKRKGIKA